MRQWMEKLPESPSENALIPRDQPLQASEKSGPVLNITSRTIQSSQLCAETTAQISISCVKCATQDRGYCERPWRGIILGRRARGCIAAYLLRIKLNLTKTPLIEHPHDVSKVVYRIESQGSGLPDG